MRHRGWFVRTHTLDELRVGGELRAVAFAAPGDQALIQDLGVAGHPDQAHVSPAELLGPFLPRGAIADLAGERADQQYRAAVAADLAGGGGQALIFVDLDVVVVPRTLALTRRASGRSSRIAAILAAAGRAPGEREGPWYDDNIKVHEYQGLTATAREIRSHGCPVLLVGPFTRQIRDRAAWQEWTQQLGGGDVRLVWVSCDPEVLYQRLIARGSERDGAKLAAYAEFVERMRPDEPPPVPHSVIDNARSTSATLSDQIERLARTIWYQ